MSLYSTPRNRRLATELYREESRPCFLTVRAYGHHAPFTNSNLNDAVIALLHSERHVYACRLYAYCLMPDHLHALAAPNSDGASVLTFIDRFKGRSTNASWNLGWSGKLWQARSYDRVLRQEESIVSVCEYILANPVRRGLVEHPDEYPWSGLADPVP